jgi:hypothetical protein
MQRLYGRNASCCADRFVLLEDPQAAIASVQPIATTAIERQ